MYIYEKIVGFCCSRKMSRCKIFLANSCPCTCTCTCIGEISLIFRLTANSAAPIERVIMSKSGECWGKLQAMRGSEYRDKKSTEQQISNMINMINKLYFILFIVSELRRDKHGRRCFWERIDRLALHPQLLHPNTITRPPHTTSHHPNWSCQKYCNDPRKMRKHLVVLTRYPNICQRYDANDNVRGCADPRSGSVRIAPPLTQRLRSMCWRRDARLACAVVKAHVLTTS